MRRTVRVGSRRSPLARVQTELVLEHLRRGHPDLEFEPVGMATSGDRRRSPGSSPDFTDAIDRALLRGSIDLAVHSAKDLPATLPTGLALVACPRRTDDRDCLVVGERVGVPLPYGARVGSSSARRRAQLLRWRGDLRVVEIRGNVDSRVAKVREGEVDAAILAVAGLLRLGRQGEIATVLPRREFLPAPAQGALAVVARQADRAIARLGSSVDHRPTSLAVEAERSLVRGLGGDCNVPIGAHAAVASGRLVLTGEVFSADGRMRLRGSAHGRAGDPTGLGRALARTLLARGAGDLLNAHGR